MLVFMATSPNWQSGNQALECGRLSSGRRPAQKKADVAEYLKVFDHVGLLTNEPPSTAGLLFN
jgi:hypothetical protein